MHITNILYYKTCTSLGIRYRNIVSYKINKNYLNLTQNKWQKQHLIFQYNNILILTTGVRCCSKWRETTNKNMHKLGCSKSVINERKFFDIHAWY